jgi:hypothetical protein
MLLAAAGCWYSHCVGWNAPGRVGGVRGTLLGPEGVRGGFLACGFLWPSGSAVPRGVVGLGGGGGLWVCGAGWSWWDTCLPVWGWVLRVRLVSVRTLRTAQWTRASLWPS